MLKNYIILNRNHKFWSVQKFVRFLISNYLLLYFLTGFEYNWCPTDRSSHRSCWRNFERLIIVIISMSTQNIRKLRAAYNILTFYLRYEVQMSSETDIRWKLCIESYSAHENHLWIHPILPYHQRVPAGLHTTNTLWHACTDFFT